MINNITCYHSKCLDEFTNTEYYVNVLSIKLKMYVKVTVIESI